MKILVALGGNALLPPTGKQDPKTYQETVKKTAISLAQLVSNGHGLAITHGNGPQVGDLLLQQEASKTMRMPLDVLGAETQGQIGYLLQRELRNLLPKKEIYTIITQVIVDPDDPGFKNPSKPVGPFYDVPPQKPGWTVRKLDKGWRRVVPSPKPVDMVEKAAIIDAFRKGAITIACGGGGIPVVKKGNSLSGVEAVIDKDMTGAIMASLLNMDLFLMLTDVDGVCLDHGKSSEKLLRSLTLEDAKRLLQSSELREGSMKPKVQAAFNFVSKNPGKKAVIASLKDMQKAVEGNAGTVVV
ncbi:MAG: carbamate kinase [Candidatus Aenigmatarchaeota archaeon]